MKKTIVHVWLEESGKVGFQAASTEEMESIKDASLLFQLADAFKIAVNALYGLACKLTKGKAS